LTAPLPAVGRDTALDECAGLLWHDFASFALCSFRELNPRTRFAMNWHSSLSRESSLPCAKAGSGGGSRRPDPAADYQCAAAPSGVAHLASVAFPAWCLGHDPSMQILFVTPGF
jgi:hypothetical protein